MARTNQVHALPSVITIPGRNGHLSPSPPVLRSRAAAPLGGQQADGVAHEVGTHHGPFGQKVFELLMTEAGEPRPEVGGTRRLSRSEVMVKAFR